MEKRDLVANRMNGIGEKNYEIDWVSCLRGSVLINH